MRIDNLLNDISNGKVFMLSHFHTDHFRGLEDTAMMRQSVTRADLCGRCSIVFVV